MLAGAFLLKQSYERPGVHEEDAKASANGGAGSARQTTKREERGSDGRKFHRSRVKGPLTDSKGSSDTWARENLAS